MSYLLKIFPIPKVKELDTFKTWLFSSILKYIFSDIYKERIQPLCLLMSKLIKELKLVGPGILSYWGNSLKDILNSQSKYSNEIILPWKKNMFKKITSLCQSFPSKSKTIYIAQRKLWRAKKIKKEEK